MDVDKQDKNEEKLESRENLDAHPLKTPDIELREAAQEEPEFKQQEIAIEKEIRKELDALDLEGDLKNEAQAKAKKLQYLEEEEKIKQLLKVAKEKGVAYAVKVAQGMNDPYLLDMFHDLLVREGYYKQFMK